LQGNVVRRAAVSKQGLRPDGAPIVGEHSLPECRLLTKRFSRLWRAALRHDYCSLPSRQNAEISIRVDVDGFIGFCGSCWCLPGTWCLRSRLNCDERDYKQDKRCLHGGNDLPTILSEAPPHPGSYGPTRSTLELHHADFIGTIGEAARHALHAASLGYAARRVSPEISRSKYVCALPVGDAISVDTR
jgi:hypothetical protein